MQASLHATAKHAGQDAASGVPLQQFLRFALRGDLFAVRIEDVREILQLTPMTPLPLMPDFVRGVMNLRGAVVPVIDLGARLGLGTATDSRRSCVVIVQVALPDDAGTQTLGVLVDAVYEVFSCPVNELEPVPRIGTRIGTEFIRSMARSRGDTTPELDLSNVLDQQMLAQLIAEASLAPIVNVATSAISH